MMRRRHGRVTLAALALWAAAGAGACRLDTSDNSAADTGSAGDAFAEIGPDAAQNPICVLVTTTEFRADGGLTVIDAATLQVNVDLTAVHADAVLRSAGERVFVVNREGGDSIQELDPSDAFSTISQRSVGSGTNPWGLVPTGAGMACVPLYNEGALLRVDLDAADGEFRVGAPIALPAADESDGRAEPLDVFVHTGVLYVIVQGLGDYPGCGPAGLARLDAFDPETLVPMPVFDGATSLALAACNPTDFGISGDQLVIGHSGEHRVAGGFDDDGGIEIVDLTSGRSLGLIANEADFGDRDLVELAVDGDTAWIALANEDFSASVYRAQIEPFELGDAVWETDRGGVFDIEVGAGRVWIADRSLRTPGVVVLDATTGERIAGPLSVGFPPFDILLVEGGSAGCR